MRLCGVVDKTDKGSKLDEETKKSKKLGVIQKEKSERTEEKLR